MSSSRYFVISEISVIAVPNTNPFRYEMEATTNTATFQIKNAKLYVPVVIFSMNDHLKFLENIKQGFKRAIFWNKCRFETIAKHNNLDYLIDPAFKNINRLFLLWFKNGRNDPTRDPMSITCHWQKSKILTH